MGLSDPSAIEQWLRSRGQSDVIRPHAWNFLQDGPWRRGSERQTVRALCAACGLIRRKPLSRNAEAFIDLSGPCPGDSAYWREMQEKSASHRNPPTRPRSVGGSQRRRDLVIRG